MGKGEYRSIHKGVGEEEEEEERGNYNSWQKGVQRRRK